MSKHLNPDTLRELLAYDDETGALTWRERAFAYFGDARLWRSWNARFAGRAALTAINANGYHRGIVCCRDVLAHRVAWAIAHDEWPDAIDHINGIGVDNRLANLRNVNHAENMRNRRRPSNNTSGAIGVSFHRPTQKWIARIKIDGRHVHLGIFTDILDAIAARNFAASRFGFHVNHGRIGNDALPRH